MACGEFGPGRMAEPNEIVAAIETLLRRGRGALDGVKALVTAGPTQEPLDPVRFIANRSSGKQGYAIADALARAGAETTLVSGPVEIAPPSACNCCKVDDGARNAGGLRIRPAGRRRGVHRRRRRLAAGDRRQQQDQEGREARPRRRSRWSRIPTSSPRLRTAQAAPASRDRLCGRDRERRRARAGQARCAKAATGSSPTMSARTPASWAATATPFISSPRTAPKTGRSWTKSEVGTRLAARIARDAEGQRGMKISLLRLPHAHGICPCPPTPRRARPGMDLLAAIERRHRTAPGASAPSCRLRHRDRIAARLRSAGAAALRPRAAITASPCSTRPARSTATIAAR